MRKVVIYNHRKRGQLDQAYSLPVSMMGPLQVVVETRAGTFRKGRGWAVVMPCDYGYCRRIGSAEGEEEWLDCFIGNNHASPYVWVIDGMNPRTDKFDEHKLMLGFDNANEALNCFNKAYDDGGARRVGAITPASLNSPSFKRWLAYGDKYAPYAADLRKLGAAL